MASSIFAWAICAWVFIFVGACLGQRVRLWTRHWRQAYIRTVTQPWVANPDGTLHAEAKTLQGRTFSLYEARFQEACDCRLKREWNEGLREALENLDRTKLGDWVFTWSPALPPETIPERICRKLLGG